jgi:diketogulonate reductase-like aldo/keto reductase
VPLVGARTAEQLEDNLGCLEVELASEHMQRLNEVSAIEPGFPFDMLSRQAQGREARITNHRAWMTDL